MVPGSKKSPGRQKQPGEAISQQLWPRYWQRPGSSVLRIWLSRINRHHSDRLAGIFTPFRRRDKPGSRCPVIWFSLLYYAMHNISTGKNIGCSVCFYGFGAATSAVGVTAGASITRITVFVCSGGQEATVRVQSITALTCPCRSKSPFPRRENCQQYAGALRCRVHSPHLHPRHPSKAGRSRTDHGQLHGTGDVI